MKKVAFYTLGCKVNQYETEAMLELFEKEGYEKAETEDYADVYVINTCTVTHMSDRKSRQYIRRMKKKNPDAIIAVVGCYSQVSPEEILSIDEVNLVMGTNDRKKIVEEVKKIDASRKVSTVDDIMKVKAFEEIEINKTNGKTRAFMKIQDGCDRFCTYCIIPYARGRVRSRKQEDILKEVRGLAREGYKEIVFTGIHISSYGMDFIDKSDGDYLENGKDLRGTAMERAYLLNLVREIAEVDGIERIRLGSLEPRIITEKFVNGLAAVPKVCPHFHLSLQSGCDETLKRMNRHYTTEEYYDKVKLLRQVFGNPAITTDVITGFPGETEEEFAVTRRFLEKVDFFEMHVFKYSRRQGTVAASMENQVPETVKAVRSGELLELEKRQSAAYRKGYIGKEITILTEEAREINGERYRIGHTDTYVKAAVPDEKAEGNMLVAGKAVKLLTEEILLLES